MNTQTIQRIKPDDYKQHGISGVWSIYGFDYETLEQEAELFATGEACNPDKKPYIIQTNIFQLSFYRNTTLEDAIKEKGVGVLSCKIVKHIILFNNEVDKIFFEDFNHLVEVKQAK